MLNRQADQALQRLKKWQKIYYHNQYLQLENEKKQKNSPYLPFAVSQKFKTLGVYKPDELGDAIYALPSLSILRQLFPNTKIILFCKKELAEFYQRTHLVDEIMAIHIKKYFYRMAFLNYEKKKIPLDCLIFLRTYPLFFRDFLNVASQYYIHPKEPRMKSHSSYQSYVDLWEENKVHQALQLLQILTPLTHKKYELKDILFPSFYWEEIDKTSYANEKNNYFVIHPYNDLETKRFGHWKELIGLLQNKFPNPIIIIGSKTDPPLNLSGTLDLTGKLTLTQMGYLLSKAKAFLGNESGPLHWACALGIPSVGIFGGHSYLEEWKPWNNPLIIKKDTACSPCHLRFCHQYELECLRLLDPKEMILQIENYLSSKL